MGKRPCQKVVLKTIVVYDVSGRFIIRMFSTHEKILNGTQSIQKGHPITSISFGKCFRNCNIVVLGKRQGGNVANPMSVVFYFVFVSDKFAIFFGKFEYDTRIFSEVDSTLASFRKRKKGYRFCRTVHLPWRGNQYIANSVLVINNGMTA